MPMQLSFSPVLTENRSFIKINSPYTLVSQTAAQQLLNSTTQGAIMVDGNATYHFRCFFNLTAMSATSGTFGFALGGTAVLNTVQFNFIASKGGVTSAATYFDTNTTASVAALTAANVNTTGSAYIEGTFSTTNTGGGTIQPQVSLGIAAAAVVGTYSYFETVQAGVDSLALSAGNAV